jgi:hypothetical protein
MGAVAMKSMTRCLAVFAACFVAAALTTFTAQPGSARASAASGAPGGTWGPAEFLNSEPGLSAGLPGITSVSCAVPGNCSAIGLADMRAVNNYAIEGVSVSETDGRWGAEAAIPGLIKLNSGGDVQFTSVSCGAAGDCSAGGSYDNGSTDIAFVVSQSNGIWSAAEPVTGVTGLDSTTDSRVTAVSCPSAGDCAAVGDYFTGTGGAIEGAFVLSETDGTWGQAQPVPGLANPADVTALACPTAGNCTAGGSDGAGPGGKGEAWTASDVGGNWSAAAAVPGMAALGTTVASGIAALSCPKAGDCAAGGNYNAGSGDLAFVADETAGVWGDAQEVPGIAALDGGGMANLVSLSCGSAGNCAATGDVLAGSARSPVPSVFVANATAGSWGSASLVAGLTSPRGEVAYVSSLSCGAAGHCTAAGHYYTATDMAGFIVSEVAGTWARGETVPGLPTGGDDASAAQAVSCAAAGYCSTGGWVSTPTNIPGFVANEATPSATQLTASAPKLTYGHEGTEHIVVTVRSPDGGTPTGTVAVIAGAAAVCAITLNAATGSCTLPSRRLPAGGYALTASYSGDSSYLASQSASAAITVARETSKTSLTLSERRATFGHEQRERFSVTVGLAFGVVPTGTVAVTAGHATLCMITLRAGHGRCVLTRRQLKAGTYRVVAAYRGDPDASPSASPRETLRIMR